MGLACCYCLRSDRVLACFLLSLGILWRWIKLGICFAHEVPGFCYSFYLYLPIGSGLAYLGCGWFSFLLGAGVGFRWTGGVSVLRFR